MSITGTLVPKHVSTPTHFVFFDTPFYFLAFLFLLFSEDKGQFILCGKKTKKMLYTAWIWGSMDT